MKWNGEELWNSSSPFLFCGFVKRSEKGGQGKIIPKSDTAVINREIPLDLSCEVGLLQQAVLCPLLQQGGEWDSVLLLKRASARLSGNRFTPGPPKESPAEAGFEKEMESETPRLKAGAKKSPLKRAEILLQSNDFWILLGTGRRLLLTFLHFSR
jgi:hypothetical protein